MREALRKLRRSARTDKPVIIRRKPLKWRNGDRRYGQLREEKSRYVIFINTRLDCAGCEHDTIIHEYAHAVDSSRQKRRRRKGSMHGPGWGAAYAAAHRETEP